MLEIVDGIPSVAEYRRLRDAVGWAGPGWEQCERALAGTVFGVVARKASVAVGMARAVGDLGVYLFVVDVVVVPAEQGAGVGRRMLDRMAAWLHESGTPHVGSPPSRASRAAAAVKDRTYLNSSDRSSVVIADPLRPSDCGPSRARDC